MLKYMIALLLVSALPLLAQDIEDIIEEVQETYEDMDNLTATFRQVETFKLTGSRNETAGKIYVKDGTSYRFESDDQVVVTNGKTVWTYNRISNQLIIDNVRKNSGALLPRDMLFVYPKEYYSTLIGSETIDNKKMYEVKLDPRENVHGFVKSMKLWVDDDEWLIHKIEVTDLNGNTTTYEIKDLDSKKKLDDSMFTFQPEEGVQVVDMRQ